MNEVLLLNNVTVDKVVKEDNISIYTFGNIEVRVNDIYLHLCPPDARYNVYKVEMYRDQTGMSNDDCDLWYYTIEKV